MVLAFTGLRWEEAVAVLIESVDLDGQSMVIERTASESGGRRDVREDMKTRAAVRTVMIADIAMPAVRRLVERGAVGREKSGGRLYSRLISVTSRATASVRAGSPVSKVTATTRRVTAGLWPGRTGAGFAASTWPRGRAARQ
jgi:integrase